MLISYALLLLAHVLAVAFWVGGMALMHFVVRPAAVATLPPPLRLPMLAATLGRFFTGVLVALVVALFSGLAMIEIAGGMAVVHRSVHTMLALGLVMMAIYGHVRIGPYRRLQAAVAAQKWPAAGAQLSQIRLLVLVNLLLGVAVFAVAIVGRVA